MKRLITLLITVAAGAWAQAQSLEECRMMAREHYPEIRQYDLIEATKQYNVSNAARAWIPQVVLSGQVTYQSATPTYPDAFQAILMANGVEMAGIRKDQYRVAIDVSQHIWDGGISKADRSMAEAEAWEQSKRLEVSLYELQARVDNIYFGILLLEERKVLTETTIAVLESNLARMRTYCKNGVAMQADVDAIEAELLTARQSLGQVEAARLSYRNMLEVLIGEKLTGEKLERPAMPTIASRTPARPELSLLSAQERVIDARREIINTSVMPRFTLFAQGFYGYPGLDMFKSMLSPDWTFNAMVGVRMSWNIGAFYTRNNNLEKLETARDQVAVQRDVFLFNTELQVTQQDGEIVRLRKALEEDDRIVELRRSVRMAAESQLENGVIDATDLLRKITDETAALLNRSTHEIELLQATYLLKNTLNQ